MDYNQLVVELKSAMYPQNRYLQNKICVKLQALKNKPEIGIEFEKLHKRAGELKEPYGFDKNLHYPENIPKLLEVYRDTIILIQENLIK